MIPPQHDIDLGNVEVVLLEPSSHARVIREILRAIGFRNLTECRTVDEMLEVVTKETPDLLVLDLDVAPDRVASIVHDIRNGRLSANPFMVVMVTTWKRSEATIRSTLNAGADDVIGKPLSVGLLNERIEQQIGRRKHFVATTTYVGPDRRLAGRQGGDGLDPISVPNSLRFKATGDRAAVCDRESIRQARLSVGLQRLHRMTIDLSRLAARLETAVGAGAEPTASEHGELASLVEGIAQYVQIHQLGQLRALVASLRAQLSVIAAGPVPSPRHYEILRLHSHAILAGLLDGDDATERLTEALKEAVSATTAPSLAAKG